MIYLTGGAGFIGTNFVRYLNEKDINKIIIVDELGTKGKWKNLRGALFKDIINPEVFKSRLHTLVRHGDVIVHLGAISSTTETDADLLWKNNVQYSQALIDFSVSKGIKLVYASSASVYGLGENGFNDLDGIEYQYKLNPLNPYGWSKLKVDEFVLQNGFEDKVVGLRLFNVWGNYEEHKEDQASIISKSTPKLLNKEKIQLFKHNNEELGRDFIFVDDVCYVLGQFAVNDKTGIYNVGTGTMQKWSTMITELGNAFKVVPNIKYVSIPDTLLLHYQFRTKASIDKLKKTIKFDPTPLDVCMDIYAKRYLNGSH